MRASVPSAAPFSPQSHLSPIDRIRDEGKRAERAARLAQQLDKVCVEAESSLVTAVAARHEQQLAWLVLCDRGWPTTQRVEGFDILLVREWLSNWGEMVALPVRILSPRDMVRIRRIRRRLERCESALRPTLPETVWQIVDPLDETGRATLACVLQALVTWLEASARCDASSRQKERLAVWLSLFTHQVRSLGLHAPAAPLDLTAWRVVADEARALADAAQQETAA